MNHRVAPRVPTAASKEKNCLEQSCDASMKPKLFLLLLSRWNLRQRGWMGFSWKCPLFQAFGSQLGKRNRAFGHRSTHLVHLNTSQQRAKEHTQMLATIKFFRGFWSTFVLSSCLNDIINATDIISFKGRSAAQFVSFSEWHKKNTFWRLVFLKTLISTWERHLLLSECRFAAWTDTRNTDRKDKHMDKERCEL